MVGLVRLNGLVHASPTFDGCRKFSSVAIEKSVFTPRQVLSKLLLASPKCIFALNLCDHIVHKRSLRRKLVQLEDKNNSLLSVKP